MRRWIPALVSFLAAASSAWAQVPEKISFQGKLSNAQNQPVNGNVAMVFRLYAGPSGGSPVWSESQTVPVVNGIYAAYLGESNPLGGVPFDATYWLSVEVNGDGEMTPRYMLSASPYSLRSRKADALEGLTVPLSQLNQLNGIGGTVTGANLNKLTDGSNADGLHVHDWGAITGKPLAFPPGPHVHSAADLMSGLLPDGRLIGTYTGALTFSNASNSMTGSFTGNGAGLTGVNATSVTNGVYTTGAYADPPWLTSLSGGKIAGMVSSATTASQLGGVGAASYARLDQAQTFAGGTQNIQSAGATQSALILRGASGQTANLQEWRDGSGGVLAAIDASGAFTGTAATSSSLATGTYSNAVTFSNAANSFAGSGAGLTNLSASSLATGSLPDARLAGSYGGALTFSNASNSFTGSGAGLTSLNPANLSAGTAGINITGNAATATNGVTTTGNYADPAWITSLAGSKVSGTVANALNASNAATVTNGVYTTGSYADPAWITSLSGTKVTGSVANATNATTVTDGVYTTGSYADPAWITSVSGTKITGAVANAINAGTVTNGVYTTGSYGDPAWITSLSGGKITGSVAGATNASQLGGVGATSYARLDQAQTFGGGTQSIVSPAAAQQALILQGASGQTANLQEWRNDSGGLLAAVDATGAFTGTAATSSNLATGTYSNAVTFSNAANSFAGSGAGLTNLSASSLATGGLPDGRLAGTYGSALTFSNASNSFTGSGAGLTNLNPANLGAGTAGINVTGTAGNVTGTVAIANGGTGTSLTVTGGPGQIVKQETVGGSFSVGPLLASELPTHTHDAAQVATGILPTVRGGTGQNLYSTGDLLTGSAAGTLSKLSVGSTGQVLTVAGGTPSWADANAHTHNDQTWTSSLSRPLTVTTDSTVNGTAAMLGWATGLAGEAWGLYGRSASTDGRGVFGFSTAAGGSPSGVLGEASGPLSRGLTGWATHATGQNYGVYGLTLSANGTGVFGEAPATGGIAGVYGLGGNNGVFGVTDGTVGVGVRGYARSATGATSGLFGQAESTSGTAVRGHATASSGTTYGVYGLTSSSNGTGVFGEAPATGGIAGVYGIGGNNGVFGVTDFTAGVGVRGYARSTTGATHGLLGQSDSTSGTAIRGHATASSGTTYGVYGEVSSPAGFGLYTPGRAHVGGNLTVAGSINGSGASLTNLNASNLSTGTVPSAALSGSYSGVTGVGTVTSGTWNGNVVAPLYGGTGAGAVGSAGTVAYSTGTAYAFSGLGVSGYVLTSGGLGAPTWTPANVHDHTGQIWGGPQPFVLTVDASSAGGTGVRGRSTNGSGGGMGVSGESSGAFGVGVHGDAPYKGVDAVSTATTGLTYGVYSRAASTDGSAIYGTATASTGATYGVQAESVSDAGTGVSGFASAGTGNTVGVLGWSLSSAGTGVRGQAPLTGVRGVASGVSGTGVYGASFSATGTTYGIYGEVFSSGGYGLYTPNRAHVGGNLTVGGVLSGSGSGLADLNAGSLITGTLPEGRLSGTYSNALSFSNAANSFSGNGSGLSNVVPADGSVTTAKISDAQVTAPKIAALPKARVRNSTPTSLPNTVVTALSFDTEDFDTNGLHDPALNPTRLTAPVAGYYRVTAQVTFAAPSPGDRALVLRRGTWFARVTQPAAAITSSLSVTTTMYFNGGDWVEVAAWQNSGGPLDVIVASEYSPVFMMEYLP